MRFAIISVVINIVLGVALFGAIAAARTTAAYGEQPGAAGAHLEAAVALVLGLGQLRQQAPEHPAALMVQDVTEPRLAKPGVGLVKVRAVHDGHSLALLLKWEDTTHDATAIRPQDFRDGAAVEFALDVVE